MQLNSNQQKAADHLNGPMLVLAGPGSGKTAVIIQRIINLTENHSVDPRSILTVTFTKAAAQEMSIRYSAASVHTGRRPVFGTFHSIFFNILKKSGYHDLKIITQKQKMNIIRSELERYHIEESEINNMTETVSVMITRIKNTGNYDPPPVDQYNLHIYREVYHSYRKILLSEKKLDFDDILLRTYDLLKKDGTSLKYWQDYFQYIMIDEFQDINILQYQIMLMLAGPRSNLFAVGDDDQSIYGFRGASPAVMNRFKEDFNGCETVFLDRNYRCPENILTPAYNLIRHNTGRNTRAVFSTKPGSGCFDITRYRDQIQEYKDIASRISLLHKQDIPFSQMAVLLRSSKDIGLISEILASSGIPVPFRNGKSGILSGFIAGDIIAYFKNALGCAQRKDLLRIINRPSRYISSNALPEVIDDNTFLYIRRYYQYNKTALDRINQLESHLKFLGRLSPSAGIDYLVRAVDYGSFIKQQSEELNIPLTYLYNSLEQIKSTAKAFGSIKQFLEYALAGSSGAGDTGAGQVNETADAVRIITMHASKGLEFREVFIPDLNENIIPSSHACDDASVSEERRLLYVAMTRAISGLHLSYCEYIYGKKTPASMFLKEACSI